MSKSIKVLDKGEVALLSYMGSDTTIVDCARVSYAKGTKSVSDDRGLIRYLMRHLHTTPFEQVVFTFYVKAPIFVFRQWHRHRTWSYNEVSGRYSELPEECYVPSQDKILAQSEVNKQGSGSTIVDGSNKFMEDFTTEQEYLHTKYSEKLKSGMRRELARINLPLSQYSEMVATVNLHNLFHFLALRLDSHAQYEIRVFAEAMYEMIKPVVPLACEAFEDYRLDAIRLTGPEVRALKEICASFKVDPDKYVDDNLLGNKRETQEFRDKILKIFGG